MTSESTYVPYFVKLLKRVLKLNLEGKTILDCACGHGRWGHTIRSCVQSLSGDRGYVMGVDIFLPYLKIVKRYNPYDDLVQCDVRFLPFKKACIDVVIAFEILEHMKKEDGYKFIENLKKVSKQSVIISAPVGRWEQGISNNNLFQIHRSTWWPSELERLGFHTLVFSRHNIGLVTFAVLAERLLEIVFKRNVLNLLMLAFYP